MKNIQRDFCLMPLRPVLPWEVYPEKIYGMGLDFEGIFIKFGHCCYPFLALANSFGEFNPEKTLNTHMAFPTS